MPFFFYTKVIDITTQVFYYNYIIILTGENKKWQLTIKH